MSLRLCKLQLKNLTTASPKTLVNLVAKFVHALRQSGRNGPLITRANRFKSATGEGSEFDLRRAAAVRTLSGLDRKRKVLLLPKQVGTPIKKSKIRPLNLETGKPLCPTPLPKRFNAFPLILKRLRSSETLRCNLEQAVNDARLLLGIEGIPGEIQSWHDTLHALQVQDELEHLFGFYFLQLCYETHTAGPRQTAARANLADRIRWDFDRLLGILTDTGRHLVAEAGQAQTASYLVAEPEQAQAASEALSENTSDRRGDAGRQVAEVEQAQTTPYLVAETEQAQTACAASSENTSDQPDDAGRQGSPGSSTQTAENKKIPDGCHFPDEPKPDEFDKGPLADKQKVLATVICPSFGRAKTRPQLRKLGKERLIWIVYRQRQLLEVYFKDLKPYSEANSKLMSTRAQKKPENDR